MPNEAFPNWWRAEVNAPPATWKYTFEMFTGDDTADEWALAAAIFVAQYRRRNSCGPTFREVFEHLLDDSHGVPAQLPQQWDQAERRRANGGFRGHVMLDWRRRGFIAFDRHVTRSLRVGPHFRERSRQLRASMKPAEGAVARARGVTSDEISPIESVLVPVNTNAELRERFHRAGGDRQRAIEASLSTEEVAARLRLTIGQLNRLREATFLHAVRQDGELRYPEWQFSRDPNRRVVPGINIVSTAIPRSWGLEAINAFMRTPRPELSFDGVLQAPAHWLDDGGDPERVVEILEESGEE